MIDRRTTVGLGAAVLVAGLALWTLQHQRPESRLPIATAATGLLFPKGFGEVEALIVEHGGFRTALEMRGGRWRQVEPFSAGVDQAAVARALDALADMPLLERIALSEVRRRELQLKDFGLAPAQTRVIVRGKARRLELCFGRLTPAGNEVYFYLDQATQVLVTRREVLDAVPVSLEQVRDRALLPVDGQPVTALELRRPGMPYPYIKLSRGQDGWQLVQPVDAPADADAVESVLAALRQVRIASFVTAENGDSLLSRLGLYGLDAEGPAQVQLWDAGGAAGKRLAFGRPIPDRPGLIYALTADGQSVVAVTNSVLRALLIAASDLRDRRVFRLAPDEVCRLQVRYPDLLVECRREAAGRWSLVSPVQDDADPEAIDRLLVSLLRVHAERVVDDPEADDAERRASAGRATCTVELAATTRTVRCTLAAEPAGDWVQVTFTHSPAVYRVAASNLPPAVLHEAAACALRDRAILGVATSCVRRLSVRRHGAAEAVERTPEEAAWQVAGGASDRVASSEGVATWLKLVSHLRAERIERLGSGARELSAFGLEDPWLEVGVDLLSNEALRKVLLVGGLTRDGGRYALVRGHDVIFVLSRETLRTLDAPLTRPAAEDGR